MEVERLKAIHKLSAFHRREIDKSNFVGCYFCVSVFLASEIFEYCDGEQTAICPRCGIDSLLPETNVGYFLTKDLLKELRNYYFETHK